MHSFRITHLIFFLAKQISCRHKASIEGMHNIVTQTDNLFQSPFHFHGPYLIESDFVVIVIDAINFYFLSFMGLPVFRTFSGFFQSSHDRKDSEFNSL